jgi:hypothetical protein
MPDKPQGRSVDGGIQKLEPENGPDLITPEEVAEPGRKRNAPDPEWLSMATADPAHFLKDVLSE